MKTHCPITSVLYNRAFIQHDNIWTNGSETLTPNATNHKECRAWILLDDTTADLICLLSPKCRVPTRSGCRDYNTRVVSKLVILHFLDCKCNNQQGKCTMNESQRCHGDVSSTRTYRFLMEVPTDCAIHIRCRSRSKPSQSSNPVILAQQ